VDYLANIGGNVHGITVWTEEDQY